MTPAQSPSRRPVQMRDRRRSPLAAITSVALIGAAVLSVAPSSRIRANVDPAQALPFAQNWTNTGQITVSDDWSGVPGITGYRGDMLAAAAGADPQTVVADGSATPVDVNANLTNPNTFTTGGVAEFELVNPTVALQGSGTADAPHLVIAVNTTGFNTITVSYTLRDVDGSADNAVQPVALQYRVGTAGNYTNIAAGFVADASTGPSLADMTTSVAAVLPADAANQPVVHVRVITADAVGSDEWIGIDDVTVSGTPVSAPTNPSGSGSANPNPVVQGSSTLLTVTVAPGSNPPSTGVTVTGNLSAIGGSATQAFSDAGTTGDATAGDNVFSYSAAVPAATAPGTYSLPISLGDAQGRSGSTSISLTVDPSNATIVMTCGGPLSTPEGRAATREVTASDEDGTVVSIVIDSIAPSDPGTITVGATTAETDTAPASATVTIGANTPVGTYTVTILAMNDDEEAQTATCSFTVTALDIIPIGTVQGQTLDTETGTLDRSPFAPATGNSAGTQNVVIQGVIYQETLARTSTGANQRGFFIQNRPTPVGTAPGQPGFDDGDPLTSDGIFVFQGAFETFIGGYNPEVGDEIILQGRVSEFFNLTQISAGLTLLAEVREDVSLAEIPAFQTAPPDDFATAMRYWERREGMRAQVPALSIVQNGRNVFPSTADAEVWVIRGDHPVALRLDLYAERVFRDPHPLDDNQLDLFDNGNGFRILMMSHGLKAASGDNTTLIAPARTFDRMTNSPIGGVYFSFGKYGVEVEQQLVLVPGVDPALNAPPAAPDRATEYSISSYNVENLYDRRDDPFDGCDFTGNAGCPGVSPPFDYVPATDAFYENHLNDIAQQIITNLHAPDVLLIQEAEDQDICTVTAGAMVCGTTNNRDGRPDTLQELALRITANGGPTYLAAYDRDGADDRGIVSAIMYRTDRVELLAPSATDPVLGSSPTVSYRGTPLAYNTHIQNPKALNADLPSDVSTSTGVDGSNVFTRPPQVALLRIWQTSVGSGQSIDLYAISNHFSSTPDARVGQRREQALYNAAIVAAIQAVTPDQRVIVGGDFNVYPRPDDPFPPPGTSDQLKPLYDAALTNLWQRLVADAPASAYSYIFQGQAQTLDSFFVVFRLLGELVQVRTAHVNSDWPNDYDGDLCLPPTGGTQGVRCPRGASDHDPTVARFRFPPLPAPPAPPAPAPAAPPPAAPPASGTAGSTGTPTTPRLPNTAVTAP